MVHELGIREDGRQCESGAVALGYPLLQESVNLLGCPEHLPPSITWTGVS